MKMKISFSILMIALLLIQFSANCRVEAWGYVAHKTVAGVAQRMLTDESWAWVRKIEGRNDATLVDICTQADEYGYSPYGGWSKPYHYVNSPFAATSFDLLRDCGEAVDYKCILNAIFNYTFILEKTVQTQRIAPPAQAQKMADSEWEWLTPFAWEGPEPSALAFLVHFISDLGQPLHAGFDCDKGGNSVLTINSWYGKPQTNNLHKIWDSTIVERQSGDWQAWVNRLSADISKDPTWIENATSAMDPVDWAAESFALATGNAYWFHVGPNAPVETNQRNYPSTNICPLELMELTEDYYEHSLTIIHQRIVYTAIRLAYHLNNIFIDFPN